MIVSNPQWQGAHATSLITGNETLEKYFEVDQRVPLSNKTERHPQIHYYRAILDQAQSFQQILDKHQPARILTLGGDCGVEPVPISYLNRLYPHMGIIWFDAHADLNLPHTSPSGNFHGMPLGILALDEHKTWAYGGSIKPQQIYYLGLRDTDPYEQDTIDKKAIFYRNALDLEELLSHLCGHKHLYVHFDVDCLDPKQFPNSYYQIPGGLDIRQCYSVLDNLSKNFSIVGGSITEVTATKESQLDPIRAILNWYRNQFEQ